MDHQTAGKNPMIAVVFLFLSFADAELWFKLLASALSAVAAGFAIYHYYISTKEKKLSIRQMEAEMADRDKTKDGPNHHK